MAHNLGPHEWDSWIVNWIPTLNPKLGMIQNDGMTEPIKWNLILFWLYIKLYKLMQSSIHNWLSLRSALAIGVTGFGQTPLAVLTEFLWLRSTRHTIREAWPKTLPHSGPSGFIFVTSLTNFIARLYDGSEIISIGNSWIGFWANCFYLGARHWEMGTL